MGGCLVSFKGLPITLYTINHTCCGSEICHSTKGQLISKCPFGIIVWTKIPTKLFVDFCPEFFCSFLGASWKLFGLPGDLVFNIKNKEAYRKPEKASRKVQKISGQKSRNNLVGIFVQTILPKGHFEIN